MSTAIEWTDETWNPVVGCTKVSQGCKHCYAKSLHDKRHAAHLAGKSVAPQYAQPFETVQLMPDRLTAPIRRRKPSRYFVNSVSDLFHEDVPDDFLDRVFAVMAIASQHTFQILTKRPARMQRYVSGLARRYDDLEQAARSVGYSLRFEGIPLVPWPIPNVWLGTSVENQAAADERIPLLQKTPAAIRFLSCEPLLGPVDLVLHLWYGLDRKPLDWVIVGGESGPGARPMDVRWAERIVSQCQFAGVAPFVKQLGAVPMEPEADWRGRAMTRVLSAKNDKRVPAGFVPLLGGDAKGGDMAYWPVELRVRQFPKVRA